MTILLVGLVVAFMAALLTGGSPSALERVRIRLDWLLLIGMIGLGVLPGIGATGLVSSTALLLSWILIAGLSIVVCVSNRHIPWLWLVALGLFANLLVVALNRGMPVLISNVPAEQLAAASAALASSWLHHPLMPDTRAPLLADVIPIVLWGRARGMASIGDLLLALGASASLYALLRDTGDRV